MTRPAKDIYGAREPGRSLESQRLPAANAELTWLRAARRARWASFFFVLLTICAVFGLGGLLVYKQRQLVNLQRAGASARSATAQMQSGQFGGGALDPAALLILDDVAGLERGAVPPETDAWKKSRWLKQTAAHVVRAERAYAAMEWPQVVAEYESALLLAPELSDAWRYLGMSYLRLSNFARATEFFEEGLRQQSDVPELWNNLGVARLKSGRPEAAEAAWKKTLELDPEHRPARENLANFYFDKNQHETALPYFVAALRDRSDAPVELSLRYARSLMTLKRWGEAAVALAEMAQRFPQAPMVFFRLAECQAAGGEIEPALKSLRRVTELMTPSQALALLARGEMDALRQRPEFQQLIGELTLGHR